MEKKVLFKKNKESKSLRIRYPQKLQTIKSDKEQGD